MEPGKMITFEEAITWLASVKAANAKALEMMRQRIGSLDLSYTGYYGIVDDMRNVYQGQLRVIAALFGTSCEVVHNYVEMAMEHFDD